MIMRIIVIGARINHPIVPIPAFTPVSKLYIVPFLVPLIIELPLFKGQYCKATRRRESIAELLSGTDKRYAAKRHVDRRRLDAPSDPPVRGVQNDPPVHQGIREILANHPGRVPVQRAHP